MRDGARAEGVRECLESGAEGRAAIGPCERRRDERQPMTLMGTRCLLRQRFWRWKQRRARNTSRFRRTQMTGDGNRSRERRHGGKRRRGCMARSATPAIEIAVARGCRDSRSIAIGVPGLIGDRGHSRLHRGFTIHTPTDMRSEQRCKQRLIARTTQAPKGDQAEKSSAHTQERRRLTRHVGNLPRRLGRRLIHTARPRHLRRGIRRHPLSRL